jgi:hypothetical protein
MMLNDIFYAAPRGVPFNPTPASPTSPTSQEKVASNGAHYTGPDYYQPDPAKTNYQPNAALPWGPDEYYAKLTMVAQAPTPAPAAGGDSSTATIAIVVVLLVVGFLAWRYFRR